MNYVEQVYGNKKRHGHARLGAIVPLNVSYRSVLTGSRAILSRRNSGRDAAINTFSVPQALLSVNKKEA